MLLKQCYLSCLAHASYLIGDEETQIGAQRRYNYALQPMSKEDFIRLVTADQPEMPAYFAFDAMVNRRKRPTLEKTLESVLKPLALAARPDLIRRTERVTAERLAEQLASPESPPVLDVSMEAEWQEKHIEGSLNIPLHQLQRRAHEVPRGRKLVVHCQSGYRSAIAASILQQHGVTEVTDLVGGIVAWERSMATGGGITTYHLPQFVEDLKTTAAETKEAGALIARLRPLVQRLALSKAWLQARHYACDAEQGFGVPLLHEETDHTLAVFAIAWLPGRGTPPHNHGTWAVVAGVDGPEKNIFWKRLDDGSRPGFADIERVGEEVFGPGEVVAFLPDDIHSVVNETDQVTVSLHVYGKHLNYTGRSQFDPEAKTEMPFIVKGR